MPTDIRDVLEDAAARPKALLDMRHLRARARASKRRRTLITAVAGVVVAGAAVASANILFGHQSGVPPSRPAPPPSDAEEDEARQRLDWTGRIFFPDTTEKGGRTLLPVVFADKTVANFSYPSELRLAELGVQTTISYTFDEPRRGAPHDIIFVPGDLPAGLLDPAIEGFEDLGASIHPVQRRGSALRGGLRGKPPYAVVFRGSGWLFVATLPRLDDARTVGDNLHFSVTGSGWPSVMTTGPLELSQGFGEARGAHVHFNDENPTFDVRTRDRYVVMGPVDGCSNVDERVTTTGQLTYGAKCLSFEGDELGIFVSIYGPRSFVRSVQEGLELAD